MGSKFFLNTCEGQLSKTPPLWLMRQAGRYLPEYRQIRASVPTFLEFCYNPKLATEATLQPIRRFGFDAAILFSDILVVPDALGQKVSFEQGEGPKLKAIATEHDLNALHDEIDLHHLAPIFETIDRLKSALPQETALIGFCGAPWTVASYMIAGHGTPDQAPARLFAYRHPVLFRQLIDRLIRASITYLSAQIEAGVEAVQIFDSWAGVLPAQEFQQWCADPVEAIAHAIKSKYPGVKIIAFPRGAATHLEDFSKTSSADVIGLDTALDPQWAARHVQNYRVVQGNLDPLALLAGGEALISQIDAIKHAFSARPYIFNLGHGILPQTPIAHVEELVRRVRS